MKASSILALGFIGTLLVAPLQTVASSIELPLDTTVLQSSDLPGYALAQQKCAICHSADYIHYQPPGMTQAQWTSEMSKMAHSYGAPLSEEDISLIGAYLAVTYGSAKATDADVVTLSEAAQKAAAQSTPDDASDMDVTTLLEANACLGCHAIDQKIVGPAFKEVAAQYRDNPSALNDIAASIQQGGSGKWGPVAMPPMSGLSDGQARALAAFVLQQ